MAINDDPNKDNPDAPDPDAPSNPDNPDDKDAPSNPDSKEIEEKYAAEKKRASDLHKGLNNKADENRQLKAEIAKYKALAGIEDEPEEETEEKPLTRAELQEQLWEVKNAQDIEIYSDEEYEADVKDGIPREKALKYAKLRAQANPDKARLDRQKQMASGSSGHREIDETDITEKDRRDMAQWGYSEEAIKKHKQLKKERGM